MLRIISVGGEFVNKGSEAMIVSAYHLLKKQFGEIEFIVASYVKKDTEKNINERLRIIHNPRLRLKPLVLGLALTCKILPLLRLKQFISKKMPMARELSEADLIVELSGFALTDQFNLGRTAIYCAEIVIAKVMRIPFAIFPQDMGPFGSSSNFICRIRKALVKVFIPLADIIVVRGKTSKQNLLKLKIKKKVYLYPDVAFLFNSASRTRAREILTNYGITAYPNGLVGIIPNIRIYERSSGYKCKNRYVKLLSNMINYMSEELVVEVVIIPHELNPDADDDWFVIKQILKSIGKNNHVHVIDKFYTAAEIKSVINELSFLITSRFHGAVASLSACIPTLILGWAHKYSDLMESMGGGYVIDYREATEEKLKSLIKKAWAENDQIRRELIGNVEMVKKKTSELSKLLKNLVSV